MRVVVLISGRGSNLHALIDAQQSGGYQIVGVASNKPGAAGLQFATDAGIDTTAVAHENFSTRGAFELNLISEVDRWKPDLIVLAGFMRVLTGCFVGHYCGRLINIHPSLLPDFPGLNTHERALEAGVQWHGASVHYVSDELDGGPVISQARLQVRASDDPQTLAARVLTMEHRLLPGTVAWIAAGRLSLDNGAVSFDGKHIQAPLVIN
jgi:phosphoribosylglycinamide formyltransferase-1